MSDKIDRLFPQFIDDIDLLQPEYMMLSEPISRIQMVAPGAV